MTAPANMPGPRPEGPRSALTVDCPRAGRRRVRLPGDQVVAANSKTGAGDQATTDTTPRRRRRPARRYPVDALLAALGERPIVTLGPSLARAVHRAKQTGLNETQADRAAIAVGYHPIELWPDLW